MSDWEQQKSIYNTEAEVFIKDIQYVAWANTRIITRRARNNYKTEIREMVVEKQRLGKRCTYRVHRDKLD